MAFFSHPILIYTPVSILWILFKYICHVQRNAGWGQGRQRPRGKEERREGGEKERFHYNVWYGVVYFPINIGTHYVYAYATVLLPYHAMDIYTNMYPSLNRYVDL